MEIRGQIAKEWIEELKQVHACLCIRFAATALASAC